MMNSLVAQQPHFLPQHRKVTTGNQGGFVPTERRNLQPRQVAFSGDCEGLPVVLAKQNAWTQLNHGRKRREDSDGTKTFCRRLDRYRGKTGEGSYRQAKIGR